MALFQPTNIIPSTFTVGVVDAEKDTATVSWQVNGNSAMTAYKIDFIDSRNATISTDKIAVGGDNGFYGTDRFGQPKMFTWTATSDAGEAQTWNAFRVAFTNGADKIFKIKITQYWKEGNEEKSLEQIEPSVFVFRKQPNVIIYRSTSAAFADMESFDSGSTLPASVGYFVCSYNQAQGAPVRECRWQVATWVSNTAAEILADTGNIDTPTLQYSFDGFFVGNSYAVRCSGKSDYQTYGTQDFDTGWVYFTVQTESTGEYAGKFSVSCAKNENATLLQWENSGLIPPTFDGGQPTIENGAVTLSSLQSITWDHEEAYSAESGSTIQTDMNYTAPWAVALKWTQKTTTVGTDKTVGGTTSHFSSVTERSMSLIYSKAVQKLGMWETTFTVTPTKPFARADWQRGSTITVPVAGVLKSPDYTQSTGDDGVLTIVTTTSIQVRNATVTGILFTQYYYDETIQVNGSIVTYSAKPSGSYAPYDAQYEIVKSGNGNTLNVKLYGRSATSPVKQDIQVLYKTPTAQGKLLTVNTRGFVFSIAAALNSVYVSDAGSGTLAVLPVNTFSPRVVALVTPRTFYLIDYVEGQGRTQSTAISYTQYAITSVKLQGGQNGGTYNSVTVYNGDGTSAVPLYADDTNFDPVWNDSAYKLYMSANFASGIFDGGVGSSSTIGFKVYRQEVGSSALTPIATLPATITQMKDFGIRSRRSYKYYLYAYDSNQTFMQSIENDTVVSTNFQNYSLLVCDYDSDNDEYHVRKQYIFALNLSEGSVGNNNSPTLNANFTSYPTRMPSTQNYASGTLQGLIGAIYTVPALIEQLGGMKHTVKASTLDYFDDVDLEKELYELSTAPYQLFLRDMKGHLRMVATNGAISMTTNLKQRQQSISISFPWVEVGDASDVTVIQTPDDYGWNNDNDVLDVRLDVDTASGVLYAEYPRPYNGTKFYLTGVNKEVLGAETPVGVTPAVFKLSEDAIETTDGTLSATAKVNTETGEEA